MIGVKYIVKPMKSIYGATIRILNSDAAQAVMSYEFTGFSVNDAVENAEMKLKKFGYYISGEANEEDIEAYYDM